ncbi:MULTISPECIES: ATP-binding protein [unclassified Idiomarina]|nr:MULTISPECIES: 4Fe-4S binding protein [unclassified Idiomarina]
MKIPVPTGIFDDLISSQKIKLCPTDAIAPNEHGHLEIDKDSCISCGMCIARCPVQAISLNETGISITYNDNSIETSDTKYSLADQASHNENNQYINENKELFQTIFSRIERSESPYRTLNNLVSKAMQISGIENVLSRQGDVNLRMDAIGIYKKKYVLCEIEKATNLDAPRDILDDVAVFCSRYDISKHNVIGMIVVPSMPNRRTEFWELLHDIYEVTGLRIAVVPLAAVLVAVWNERKIPLEDFFLDHNNMSARGAVENMLGRAINLPSPCDLLEPEK